ncbi:MAG TPA: hypothetical protein VNX68_06805 [Nitrosopumilaceae archaeon]|jgi:hypothetical protein|nr:hypothetical protein [Nitrosopumilaceae archaeon]
MDHLDVIEQFRRLDITNQRKLAEQFGLTRPDDAVNSAMITSIWLLRAKLKNILNEFGKAVQEAS